MRARPKSLSTRARGRSATAPLLSRGLLLNGISSHSFSVRLSRKGAITPGIASLNPGLMS
jgi:hypothetical protein